MKSAFFYEDDRVVVLTYELGQSSHRLSYNDLVPSEMASVSGKQEITLACADYLEPALEDDILAFNTSNADYEVQVKYYQQEGMTEDLVNLLEFCKKYGYEHGTGGNLLESARDRTLIMFDTGNGYTGTQMVRGMYDAEVKSIGFPCAEGNGDAIRLTGANLTMTSFSDCKEGVWEFIKYCLSEERQSSQYEPINANKFPTIYPVNRKGFEACAQSMLSIAYDYILDENGEATEIVEHGSYTISIEDDTFYYNAPT